MIVRLPVLAGSAYPSIGVPGTVSGVLVGTVTSDGSFNSAMFDQSDVTYLVLNGGASSPVACAGELGGFGMAAFPGKVPANSIINSVTIACRLRQPNCASGEIHVYFANSLAYTPFPVSQTSTFLDFNFLIPTRPGGLAWSTLTPLTFYNSGQWGLLVNSDCPAGGNLEIHVSEMSVLVNVSPPTPVVTTGAVQASVASATLNGTVNPNQSQVGNQGIDGVVSMLFPVSWRFHLGTSAATMSPLGEPSGAFICGPPNHNETPNDPTHPVSTSLTFAVSTEANNLTPDTMYFYALSATADDIVTFGATQSFRTPVVDPSFGAF